MATNMTEDNPYPNFRWNMLLPRRWSEHWKCHLPLSQAQISEQTILIRHLEYNTAVMKYFITLKYLAVPTVYDLPLTSEVHCTTLLGWIYRIWLYSQIKNYDNTLLKWLYLNPIMGQVSHWYIGALVCTKYRQMQCLMLQSVLQLQWTVPIIYN